MTDYINVFKSNDTIVVNFYVENSKPYSVGEKINEINKYAYMNGYNWEILLDYYLLKNFPELKEGMDTDPESGTYTAYFSLTPENEKKAEKFKELIVSLIENENTLYEFVRENGNKIEWD